MTGRGKATMSGPQPDHLHIKHRNTSTTLQYIHLSGRDLAARLAAGMEQVHSWRLRQLAHTFQVGDVD